MPTYDEFQRFRETQNQRILEVGTLTTRRFMGMDAKLYEDGALTRQTKEMLGLVASLVLRCDDCVAYHLDQSVREGLSREQVMEALDIGLVIGGSIVIPHLRRAVAFLDECLERINHADD